MLKEDTFILYRETQVFKIDHYVSNMKCREHDLYHVQ